MTIPLEEYIPCRILALLVLAVFYGIYLVKQGKQKCRGIPTMQIGRRKETQGHTVKTLMGIASAGIIPAQLLSIGFRWSHLLENTRFTGFCVGLIGDLIFLISVLCMKNSWRDGIPNKDKTKLITDGIYRYSRNPAFWTVSLQFFTSALILHWLNKIWRSFSMTQQMAKIPMIHSAM